MVDNGSNHGLNFCVDEELLVDSLSELAQAIDYISAGHADDLHDRQARKMRRRARMYIYRIGKLLNCGDLDDAQCKILKMNVLESIWDLVCELNNGPEVEYSQENKDLLFLPHELDLEGRLRGVDDKYVAMQDYGHEVADGEREDLSETKRLAWSWFSHEMGFNIDLLDTSDQPTESSKLNDEAELLISRIGRHVSPPCPKCGKKLKQDRGPKMIGTSKVRAYTCKSCNHKCQRNELVLSTQTQP